LPGLQLDAMATERASAGVAKAKGGRTRIAITAKTAVGNQPVRLVVA
jgi:hypothetical protein